MKGVALFRSIQHSFPYANGGSQKVFFGFILFSPFNRLALLLSNATSLSTNTLLVRPRYTSILPAILFWSPFHVPIDPCYLCITKFVFDSVRSEQRHPSKRDDCGKGLMPCCQSSSSFLFLLDWDVVARSSSYRCFSPMMTTRVFSIRYYGSRCPAHMATRSLSRSHSLGSIALLLWLLHTSRRLSE